MSIEDDCLLKELIMTALETILYTARPGQRLATYAVSESQRKEREAGQEEWQDRLRSLEQCICELLIKNQQLRAALESATSGEGETG